ncbi:MAG: PKD domain-containing protein, partial [Planctomycetes bacterium]|nr:PKD domain-containing protein [Planctomycetota bacterium]
MDANGNGFGIQSYTAGTHCVVYEGGQAMDALCATQLPDYRIYAGTAGVTNGRKFKEIVQDMVDMYAYGQNDSGGAQGGWQYGWNTGVSDNSAAQWGCIGMMAAEDVFGCTIPAGVKDKNYIYLQATYDNIASGGVGGFGYNNRTPGFATSASGLVQLIFDKGDDSTSDSMWAPTVQRYVGWWQNDFNPSASYPNHYAAYAFAKAMRLAKPEPILTIGDNFDWFGSEGTTQGLGRILYNFQKTSGAGMAAWGSWDGYNTGAGGYLNDMFATAWCTTILTQSLFELVPVAEAGPNLVWGKNQARMLDASYSYHLDPERTIVKYEWIQDAPAEYDSEDFHYVATRRVEGRGVVYYWDLDGDQVTDITTETPAIEHTWVLPMTDGDDYLPYTVTLKITDDNQPTAQTDTDTFTALILDVKPPQSDPGGTYVAYEGVPVQLDGTGSSEWDPGDFITQYDWLLSGGTTVDKTGDASTASVFDWRFFGTGSLTIGLTVYDNGVGLPEGERLSNTEYTTVEVVPNNLPTADAGGPYTMEEGASVQLTAQGSSDPDGHPLTYTWGFDNDGDGQVDEDPVDSVDNDGDFVVDEDPAENIAGMIAPFSVNDHGVYTVRVYVWDGAMTEGGQPITVVDDALVTVTDKHPTVAFSSNPAAPYEGQVVQFTSNCTSSPDPLDTWDWDFDVAGGASTDSTATNPAHTYADNGVYTVRLTVKDDDDVTGSTLEKSITVRDTEPVPNFTFAPVTPVLVTRRRDGIDVTFTDTSTPGQDPIVSRDWTFSDGGTASGS